ncbi:Palmitoyltransferase erf2 [Choanephora cucurbitarum]|uniref:Palmitoyltransferase n=1 Tax=Choanephora cucurbitarum TaxID=101091 RepID=A0A1C7N770_9FUNG|nr:Palmitoyltransferase erf2 [Choanephora cucurbitarum]
MIERGEQPEMPLPFVLNPLGSRDKRTISFGASSKRHSMVESFEEFNFPPTMASPSHNLQSSAHTTVPSSQQPEPARVVIIKGKRPSNTRNYKLYIGNTVFFCGGRFLTSRAFWAFGLSLFLISMPAILFIIFSCPWLWYHVSPAIPILFAYMFILTLAAMLKTSWTDPGILPRNLDSQSWIPNRRHESTDDGYGFRYSSMSEHSGFPLPKEVTISGTVVRLKYCETCCIYRPPRAKNEDHHCIWLNNCIGKRNYTTFFTFIICATILCCYTIAFSFYHVFIVFQETGQSFQASLLKTPVSFFVAIFCLLLLVPIGSLTSYHCFLMMRGVTTHEQLRSNLAQAPFEDHPYNFGNPLKNIYHILCRPHNKSYLARRKFAEEVYDIQPTNMTSNLSTATTSSIPLLPNQISND